MTELPHGTWPSPLSAADLAASTVSLSDLCPDGRALAWIASRPDDGGRYAVMYMAEDGGVDEITPPGFSARTRVHEYGGGALAAGHGVVLACEWTTQRVHRLHGDRTSTPVTPEPITPAGIRWAAMRILPGGTCAIAIRETHGPDRPRENDNVHAQPEAVNEIVALDLVTGEQGVLVTGPDFVGGPWVNPAGTRLAWLEWDHPDMPWDTAELWVADLVDAPGAHTSLAGAAHVAGGRSAAGSPTSVADARWLDDDRLAFTVDPDGWWNVHLWTAGHGVTRLQHEAVESGMPRWVHSVQGLARAGEEVVAITIADATGHLRRIPLAGHDQPGQPLPLEGVGAIGEVASLGTDPATADLVAVVGGPAMATAIWRIDPRTGAHHALTDGDDDPAARIGALPHPISFPTTGGATAHALYYPPTPSAGTTPPPGERPPLVVLSHGGPTAMARTSLNGLAQYWASRGLAVVDVNYRGSTGYGRAYRDALIGCWGLHDRDDCIAAATHLVAEGHADPDRLVIEGGSAGGYTTLLTLCTSNAFAAGGSLFGVADLCALATDTHKFESRYLDSMVGPWPAEEQTYVERSPITHVDRLATPMIVLQGDEDTIVPPAQAELIVAALREKGLPHAYLLFAGEQHGFRNPPNIIRSIEARLAFYGRVLGFQPADPIDLPEYVGG